MGYSHLLGLTSLHWMSDMQWQYHQRWLLADFTYGNDYDAQGKMVYGQGVSKFFHWDKRDYTYEYPPKSFPLPPKEVSCCEYAAMQCCKSGLCNLAQHVPYLPCTEDA